MRGYPHMTMRRARQSVALAWLSGLGLLFVWLGFVYWISWMLGM